ncbi:hypothetical protein EFK50_06170 [Nocardioides marmoriginsengisoli]|uniref:Secreted protein n=1 Tax=Nocardioides marmoriginsengisoli TaxID=661483 RepID=A0A3N0CKZ1_9ACTN|nr:hypothetical protein [Nocardioides marmoriginsengisoli]RNL64124.1 hypothetical protein EFK50_06170 [Nocardioides marmoriginsengisoli]
MSEILSALGGAVSALLVVALISVARRRSRGRADLEAMLDAAHRESDDLRAQLDDLVAPGSVAPRSAPASPTYVITDAGSGPVEPAEEPVPVPDRLVLSATLGAPLVKAAAFTHGLRRAFSAESRNRIWFEMRREVRSSRKRRRRQVREHLRNVRADERAQEGLA